MEISPLISRSLCSRSWAFLSPVLALLQSGYVAVGLQAVVNILFSIVAFVASIVVEILDFLSLHFTRGRLSVHDKTVGVLINRRGVYVDEEKDEVLPHQVQIGENSMCKSTIGCYYGGSFGMQMQPILHEKIRALGAEGEIASIGAVSLYSQDQQMTSVGVNVSPTPAERAAILAASHNDEEANTHLLGRLGEKLIDIHLPLKSIPSSLLFFLDRDVLTSASTMLKMVKRQLPFHTIAVITMLDEKDLGKEAVRKGLQELVELYEEGAVTTIFVFSSRSPFAIAVKLNGGEVKQLEFVAQTLTSLLLTRRQSKLNASCVDVLRALGRLSPFSSFAFAADRVARIKLRGIRALLMWLIGKKALVGDKVNIRDQAEYITGRVLADTECRAIDQVILPGMPAVLIYNLPLALRDKRFGFVQKELIKFLGRVYPSTKSLVVRGNGIPVHPATDPLDPFYVQVSCLYPLRALGRLSPFISFAFAADRVARIKLRGIQALLMWLIGKKALVGDKVNIRDQAEYITGRVLADTECRAMDQVILPGMPAVLIYNLPLALRDKRFGFVQKELIKFSGEYIHRRRVWWFAG